MLSIGSLPHPFHVCKHWDRIGPALQTTRLMTRGSPRRPGQTVAGVQPSSDLNPGRLAILAASKKQTHRSQVGSWLTSGDNPVRTTSRNAESAKGLSAEGRPAVRVPNGPAWETVHNGAGARGGRKTEPGSGTHRTRTIHPAHNRAPTQPQSLLHTTSVLW